MNIKALACWILVSLPLGWGLYKSIERATPLFQGKLAAAKAAPAKAADAPNK